MPKLLNSNWKTLVIIVIMVLVGAVGWMVKLGFGSVINRLDTIEAQTRDIPVLKVQVEQNTDDIEQAQADVRELQKTKVDKK